MAIVSRISAILLCTFAVACACAEQKAAGLYKTNCIACHGATGEADTPAGKALNATSFSTSESLNKSDGELAAIIKNGKDKMPPWSEVLTDDQVRDIIAYIRTLKREK